MQEVGARLTRSRPRVTRPRRLDYGEHRFVRRGDGVDEAIGTRLPSLETVEYELTKALAEAEAWLAAS